MLKAREVQKRCMLDLSTYQRGESIPGVRKKKCPVTQGVPPRRDAPSPP
jgi:hypothetical protein